MGRTATSVEQQIAKLRKRGMLIQDEAKAKEILMDIGYYRLGFYWYPFEIDNRSANRKHQFQSGTDITDALNLYYFDFDLRNILLRYLTRIEINFRTKLVYTASNQYPNTLAWFADPGIMAPAFAADFYTKYYKKAKKHSPVLRQHHKKYPQDNYAPAWKLMEFLPMGENIQIYSMLSDPKVQEQICRCFGVNYVNVFTNYIHTVRNIRNACAHGEVIYDLKLPISVRSGPAGKMTADIKNNIRGALKVIGYFLNIISANRYNDMINEIKALEAENAPLLQKIAFTCF